MGVIGRADGDGVDALADFVEQLAEVVVLGGLGELVGLGPAVERVVVDVADGHDVAMIRGVVRVAASFAADADAGEADHFVRRVAFGGLGA